jgi:predicted phosphodiesterase
VRLLRSGARRGRLAPLLLLTLVACGGGSESPGGPPTPPNQRGLMTRGPYLQHSEDGVAVTWYTETTGEGRVRFFSDSDQTGEVMAPSGALRHEATLTGLVPNMRYSYRLYSASGPLTAASGEVEFAFRAPDPNAMRFVVFADCGSGSAGQLALARAIAAEPVAPQFVMLAGDVVYPPADAAGWDARFFATYRALLPALRFYAVAGNHDFEVFGGRLFYEFFTLPRNGAPGLAPESSYWLERGGALLIAHDTNQTAPVLRQHAIPWHNEVARRESTFRIVVQHHSLFTSGPNFMEPPVPELRQLLAPLYTASGVDVVFAGHDHFYERTRPIAGVVSVTTGAGGATLYPRVTQSDFTAAFANDRHSYTYVDVNERTLTLRQMDLEGRTIDSATLTKAVAFADPLAAQAGPARGPGRLLAQRGFALDSTLEPAEAVLRVRGVSDYRIRLNDVEVARGGVGDGAPAAFNVPARTLRAGRNALVLEGFAAGPAGAVPGLELVLVSSGRR